jgi:hypothetical protein
MLGRKDVLLIVFLVVSAVLLAVSRPDNMDIREVVWNFAFMLIFGSVIAWLINEIFSWLGEIVTYDVGVPKVNLSSMSRNGLIVLAEKEGIANRRTLDSLTEEDIMMLLNNNGTNDSVKKTNGNMVVAIVLKLKDMFVAVVNKIKSILVRKKKKKK